MNTARDRSDPFLTKIGFEVETRNARIRLVVDDSKPPADQIEELIVEPVQLSMPLMVAVDDANPQIDTTEPYALPSGDGVVK
jgi:hypothetical protein